MLLAIDTSAGTSVALVALDGTVAHAAATADTRRHAELVGEYLVGVDPSAVTGVVVGVGPGPFTGLRVGIAAAKAFAWGAEVPLLPVVSHDAIAAERYAAGFDGDLTIATDARRRELFVSRYAGVVDGVPTRSAGPLIESELPPGGTLAEEVSAVWLARIALAKQQAGQPFESDQAVYLRSPDVTMPNPGRRVS